jgi:hypothetical protein
LAYLFWFARAAASNFGLSPRTNSSVVYCDFKKHHKTLQNWQLFFLIRRETGRVIWFCLESAAREQRDKEKKKKRRSSASVILTLSKPATTGALAPGRNRSPIDEASRAYQPSVQQEVQMHSSRSLQS